MPEFPEQYEADLVRDDLPPKIKTQVDRTAFFQNPTTREEILMSISPSNKFTRVPAPVAKEKIESDIKSIKDEIGRKAISVGSYLFSLALEDSQFTT